ncbi:NnrS family protein [Pseudaquidulcibacter saccharophilus]|uniref:NnrS family protein n=1 Tax=Pseudaquidulcibacter saccharophilus TaxID=2831900 RepID=UPI0023D96AF3|nr:NnrS family protein [Pseudaquidulcibacter saccharophilus]
MEKIFKSPLFSGGFRPFFLLAAVFMFILISYFALGFAGYLPITNVSWDLINWHRHEMLFGFTAAVIAGFLLTAVPNWTGQQTPKNEILAALAGFWLLGRLAMMFSSFLPKIIVALIDVPFYLLVAASIFPALTKTQNKRNYFFLGLLSMQTIANALMHFGLYDIGMRLGLNIIVLIMLVLGGRVIPFFTENAKAIKITRNPNIEKFAMISAIIAAILDVLRFLPALSAFALLVAAIANLLRFSQWQSKKTFDNPLLWILHIGYLWLVVGLFLKAIDLFGISLPNAIANHAITSGAIGSLTLGMMARVSLGHTGRPLAAAPKMIFAFWLVNMAAFARVFGAWALPNFAIALYLVSALMMAIAFLIFVIHYFPILTTERYAARR